MKSENHGTSISQVEVLSVSPHGIWLWVDDAEYFLDHESFPWFAKQSVEKIFNVELLHGHHLFWKDLDIDLELDCIANPEKYPLKAI